MSHTEIDKRMKRYELPTKQYLVRRTPVIMRLDGKAFHTFTKGLLKPFDKILVESMQLTMVGLCKAIDDCVFGYTQSDEITLVLVDYKTLGSNMWFDGNIQKMASLAASEATALFNGYFSELSKEYSEYVHNEWLRVLTRYEVEDMSKKPELSQDYTKRLLSKCGKARFDCQVFNLPKEEVCNNLIWRQQDATRNSIQAVGQAHFSNAQLMHKNTSDIQEMLLSECGINWNDFPAHLKRGSCCYRVDRLINEGTPKETIRGQWKLDEKPPIFTRDRGFVEKWILLSASDLS